MKTLLAFILVVLTVSVLFVPTLLGLYLAAKASIVLFLAMLIMPPIPTVIGWLAIFGHPEVCRLLAAWAHMPL